MKLNEAAQFVATHKNVSALLTMYGLELAQFSLATSGIENCTMLVTTTAGDFVLRVYRQDKKSDDDILQEIDFIRFLHKNELPMAIILPTQSGDFLAHMHENGATWQAILMERSPGEHAKHYSAQRIHELAHLQARMHILAASYTSKTTSQEITFLQESYFIPLIDNRNQLSADRQHFVNRAEKYTVALDASLPKGLCHLDFDNGNVLSHAASVTAILDFDDLTLAPYAMCLAYTLWAIYFDTGSPGAKSYLEKYCSLRDLNELEKQFLVKILLFRHYANGCMNMASNHMDDTKLKRYIDMEHELLQLQ